MQNDTILLVEDNEDDEALTIRALKNQGLAADIRVARDGREALELLLETAGDRLPRVVLLDLKLPLVDGFEVLRRLRAQSHTRRLPVVVLSSSDEERDVVECYDLGANSYVRKPVDFVEFETLAKRLGEYWLSINEVRD